MAYICSPSAKVDGITSHDSAIPSREKECNYIISRVCSICPSAIADDITLCGLAHHQDSRSATAAS
jgi:hypothetical protein